MRQGVNSLPNRWQTFPIALLCCVLTSGVSYAQTTADAPATACQSFNYSTAVTPASHPAQQAASAATLQASRKVNAQLRPGLLQPQVEALIKQGFAVTHIEWRASPHYRWSSNFEVTAVDWQSALGKILRPYQLQLTLYANNTAVVSATAGSRP